MTLETLPSVATLGGLIWTVRFLLPKAAKEREPFALVCAALTVILTALCAFSSAQWRCADRASI